MGDSLLVAKDAKIYSSGVLGPNTAIMHPPEAGGVACPVKLFIEIVYWNYRTER